MSKSALLIGTVFIFFNIDGYSQVLKNTKPSWSVKKPFQRSVFIENNGQLSADEEKAVGSKVLYYTHKGSLWLYYTTEGLIFRKDSIYSSGDKEETDEDNRKKKQTKHLFTKMQWIGCNLNIPVEVENKTADYFTFPNPADKTGKSSVIAHAWTKLRYKNIYNGIDIEFYYPEKGGVEYNIIVHPGANLANVKILYSSSSLALSGKDVKINTEWGELTDHAPSAKDDAGKEVASTFKISGKTVSFIVGNYDKSKNLIIDPWVTTPTLGGFNRAFDIGYDYMGNVYIYGGDPDSPPYELQKYNSSGNLQWTFQTVAFNFTSNTNYGGMTVDHKTGTSYICQAFTASSIYPKVLRVNSSGIQSAILNSNDSIGELWRIGYDYCNNQLILGIGGRGWFDYPEQAGLLDTNLTTLRGVNVLSAPNCLDIPMIGFDNVGHFYLCTCHMYYCGDGNHNSNELCKASLPSLTPPTYIVQDKHSFVEVGIAYYTTASNGYNGLAATPTFVYTYDGSKMREWNAATGAIVDSATVNSTTYAFGEYRWGGLDIDCQGNIYCGNAHSVSIYDSNMNSLGNIPLSDTVYALQVAPNGDVYACGNGFVESVNGASKLVTTAYTLPSSCSACDGTATASTCGKGSFTYQWSTGATTQTISGLCAGIYTVTAVATGTCLDLTDTAIVNVGGSIFPIASITAKPDTICKGDSVLLIAGQNAGYSYQWSTLQTTDTIKVAPSADSTYSLTVSKGTCSDSTTKTVHVLMPITATAHIVDSVICPNDSSFINIQSGNGIAYKWSNGATTSAIRISDSVSKIYTGTVYGPCGDSLQFMKTVTVVQLSPPVVSGTPQKCFGGTDTLTVSGGTTYKWSNGSTNTIYYTGPINADSTFTVIAYNAIGCPDTAAVKIAEKNPPTVAITTPTPDCGNNPVTIKATASGTGPFTYSWSPGGNTAASITVTPDSSTTYTVVVSNGCTTVKTTTITVSNPILSACCDNTIILGDDTIITANGNNIKTYQWQPDTNISCDSCPVITVDPKVTTTYTVTGTDSAGCQIERLITIKVEMPCSDFIVPNVFTPNYAGPLGENNSLYIQTAQISGWLMTIYDRWGKVMFKTNSATEFWNGNTEGGEQAPDGVYYYIIEATCQGKTYKKDGFVQLIR